MDKDYIGRLVKQFESGNKGSLAIGNCGFDWGCSYGSYQLTLRFGCVINFLKKYFPNESESLYFKYDKDDFASRTYPGEDYCSRPEDVKKIWLECYNNVGADKFFEYEYEFIDTNYYKPLLVKIRDIINPNTHSRMLQECMWSWAVHKGVNGAYTSFKDAISNVNINELTTEKLLDLLYNMRYKVNRSNRYKLGISKDSSERELLRDYCNDEPLTQNISSEEPIKEVEKDPASSTTSDVLFRVQLGTFKIAANAIKLLVDAKTDGFSQTYVVHTPDGMYKVRLGAFTDINEAKKYVTAFKGKGYNAIIIADSES